MQWINDNQVEFMSPEGETVIVSSEEIHENDVFLDGLSFVIGSEILAIKPE